jgi:hypothetical protein
MDWLDRHTPRRRLAIAGGAVLSLTAAIVWAVGVWSPADRGAAFATTPSAAAASRVAPHVPGKPLAVGASVMLASQEALGRHMTVDAAVGRQASDVIARLETYRAADRLPRRVVVQIGENGPLGSDDIQELRRTLADVQRVVLVNVRVPRTWVAQTNDVLSRAVKAWPQARVADWYDASAGADLLYDDETHPTPQGRRVYARIVRRALQG